MSKRKEPIEYEPVQLEEPIPFPWIALFKLLLAALAVPITIYLLWLLVLACYWFTYGKWPDWDWGGH
jgi:hypothetical protein